MMGFWIFMLAMDLLIPATMIGFGYVFVHHPPKKINDIYGYRTTMSTKNQDTWQTAHAYCGKLWWVLGWISLPTSVIPLIFVIGKDADTVGVVGGIICAVQTVVIMCTILPVERKLRRIFDKNGNRR